MFGRFIYGGASSPVLLFDFDFSTLSAGPISQATFLSTTGLNFSRSTASTVQTSDSTLNETPATNNACIGNRTGTSTNAGLVIQQNTFNLLGSAGDASPRNLTVAWAGGTMTSLGGQSQSPDTSGTGCSSATGGSGTFSNYGVGATSSARCFSSWQRSIDQTSNGNMFQVDITTYPPAAGNVFTARSANNTWGRIITPKPNGVAGQYLAICDCRDYSGIGGDVAQARSVYVDYIQLEDGVFATEAIPTGQTERRNDRCSYASASDFVSIDNQIKTYYKFTPKFSSSMEVGWRITGSAGTVSKYYLWSIDANNYAYINATDLKLYVKIAGGTETISTNAISFSQFDIVELYLAVGGNIASIAKYKLNGGSWVDLSLATITNTPAPGAVAIGLLFNVSSADNVDTGTLPCWFHKFSVYDTSAPDGI